MLIMNNIEFPSIKGYKLVQELGKGAFGRVYSTIREDSGESFAIKVLRDADDSPYIQRVVEQVFKGSRKELFENESLVSFEKSQLTPNLVPSKVIEIEGTPYLLMPLFDTTLKKFSKNGNINEENFYNITRQIILGLAQLHTLNGIGYFHFDLKPDCILLREKEGKLEAAIGDFGTNRPLDSPVPEIGDIKRSSPLNIRKVFQPSNDINLVGKTLLETLIGTYPGKHIVRPLNRRDKQERGKILTYIANQVDENLKPTQEYRKLVQDNLNKLPEFISPQMSELIQAMLFEEIKGGTELLKEFDKITK